MNADQQRRAQVVLGLLITAGIVLAIVLAGQS